MTGDSVERPGHDTGYAADLADELAAALHGAVTAAVGRFDAVTAAVYLLTEPGGELKAAMIGGAPPAVYTLPGRIRADAAYASARALADGTVAVLADPDRQADEPPGAMAYPYTAAAAPIAAAGRRFGTLTILRPEDGGGYGDRDRVRLAQAAEALAAALASLAAEGTRIVPGHLPVLVPVLGAVRGTVPPGNPGWGVPGVPGSAGLSMMYPLQRMADMLARATTVEDVVAAARFGVMTPFHGRGMVLATPREGRLWVLGLSGDAEEAARRLHGTGLHTPHPAVRALSGRALFRCGDEEGAAEDGPAAAYLPLAGSRHVIDLPPAQRDEVVGVCCIHFPAARRFSAEERAVLTMMTGLLGSAVERVELARRRQALARSLQKRLLPAALPALPRLATTARHRPSSAIAEVGGDWYDVIELPDGRVALVLGDVEGHSIESPAVMGQLRGAVTAYATEGHGAAAVVERTGRLLDHLGTGLLATCCVILLDLEDGVADVALAGHPAPLVRHPDATVSRLDAPANVPLGVPTSPWRAREHVVEPGSLLLLYSDGLFPTPDDNAPALLTAACRDGYGGDLEELADRLLRGAADPHGRRDDASLLLAHFESAAGDPAPRTGHLHIQRRDLRAVRDARFFIHDRLSDWGLAELSDDLQLIASEVVTNALVHAGSEVDVRLRAYPDRIRLEVRDSETDPPVPTAYSLSEEGSAQAEHGRGLFLVDALADSWNCSPNGRGKTVWLEIGTPRPGTVE